MVDKSLKAHVKYIAMIYTCNWNALRYFRDHEVVYVNVTRKYLNNNNYSNNSNKFSYDFCYMSANMTLLKPITEIVHEHGRKCITMYVIKKNTRTINVVKIVISDVSCTSKNKNNSTGWRQKDWRKWEGMYEPIHLIKSI
jgi:hypothetical protein